MAFQFRICLTHLIDNKICDSVEEQVFKAERVPALVYPPPHNFAQNVIPAFVRRQDSVGNRERSRTRMIGDHAHRKAFLCFRFVLTP